MNKIFLLLTPLFLVACLKSKKDSWQGTFYPEGCLTCDSEYIYSPIFKSYGECKDWATSKVKNDEDKASCGSGCEFEGKMDMSKCDVVVRSWIVPILPDSPTFDSYKE